MQSSVFFFSTMKPVCKPLLQMGGNILERMINYVIMRLSFKVQNYIDRGKELKDIEMIFIF